MNELAQFSDEPGPFTTQVLSYITLALQASSAVFWLLSEHHLTVVSQFSAKADSFLDGFELTQTESCILLNGISHDDEKVQYVISISDVTKPGIPFPSSLTTRLIEKGIRATLSIKISFGKNVFGVLEVYAEQSRMWTALDALFLRRNASLLAEYLAYVQGKT